VTNIYPAVGYGGAIIRTLPAPLTFVRSTNEMV